MTTREVAEAADANFLVHAAWAAGRTPGMKAAIGAELALVDSGLPCDTFNFVLRARLGPGSADRAIAAAIAHFGEVGRPFSWWVGPADAPTGLGERLVRHGLEAAESELAMAADLERLPRDEALPPGLEIRRVTTLPALTDFARVNAANWDPPDPDVLRFHELTAAVTLQHGAPQWFYVGYLEGEPVATAELTIGGGVAGLYGVSTPAAFRRLGFEAFGEITEYEPPATP